jgi:hypothetical protein
VRNFIKWQIILVASVIVFVGNTAADADDDVFGIKIEQRALDVLTLALQRLAEVRGATDLEQMISIKAKIIVADVLQPGEIMEQIPKMIFRTRIELFKARIAEEDLVRVNLTSSFGDLQFLATGSESLAVLPEFGVFTKMDTSQMLPANIILPEDDGGLFTMINLLGGVPFGSLLRQPSIGDGDGGGGLDIGFVEELEPADLRAVVRYRGKGETEAGTVHIVTVGSSVRGQYIKIWVLEDTLDLYQISIEDERGTEVFVVIEKVDTSPTPSEATFTLDRSGFAEIGAEEFVSLFMLKIATSPAIDAPMIADLSASSHRVARTGMATISADGFDLQDREDQLIFEAEYRSPGGSWTPLETIEYAGIAPLGHWNAIFAPDDSAELGMYSFRARYTDSSGNASEWLEALDIVTVTPAPPRVVRAKPVDRETGVPVSTEIAVTFSKPMDKGTVEKAFSIVSGAGRIIRGSFTWEENTVIFSPSSDLEHNTNYLARVTGAAMDTDGISLDGNYDTASDGVPYDDYIWSFTTPAASPVLEFVSADRSVYIGDRFNIRIRAKYVTAMHKFSLNVVFDPEVLEVESVDETSFASWRPRPKFIEEADRWSETVIDNSAGIVTIACDGTRTGGVSGAGYIATISLNAIGVGTAALSFRDVSVIDSRGTHIAVDLHSAEIQVIEFHPMDVNHDGVVNILDFVAIASGKNGGSQAAPRSATFGLEQNYPNPFNPETWIPYQLARSSYVIIRIYRSTGELMRTLDLGRKEPGFYMEKMKAAYWDGTDDAGQRVSSGVYFYTIQADEFTATRKMLLCR